MPKTISRRKIQANRRNAPALDRAQQLARQGALPLPQPAVRASDAKNSALPGQHERQLHRTIRQFRQLRKQELWEEKWKKGPVI